MDDPPAFGHCRCHEVEPATHDPVPRPKRLLDSAEQAQVLQSAKKVCVGGRHCSSPDPASHFLDDTDHDDLVASSVASKYDDVAISLDTFPCFDDSEPDDSLLELSDGEGGNSPFNYTEEEIQEILADDCVESERYISRESALSQNGNSESEKDESSNSSTGTSVLSDDTNVASEITETPNESLSRESSPLDSECYPSLMYENASVDENQLQSAQVTLMLFDLDIQELLSLSPIDADDVEEPLEDGSLEEAEREASEAIANDCLECEKAAGSCVLEESTDGLLSESRQSPDRLGETPVTSRDVSNICGDHVERSVSSSGPACEQSTADGSSTPTLPTCPAPSSGSRNQELPKAKSCFSRKLEFLEDDEGEPTEAEQPSNSIEHTL
nr:retinitis pigmentosa 1-like 1 protein isoform X2 [Columba livia]